MNEKKVEIPCQEIRLEGMFALPEGEGPFGLVIVCHPHPLYGGNMDNNVVEAVCRAAGTRGLASLKFNFRGVGRSGGHFSGGAGEKKDARAAIAFGAAQEEVDGERIGICGYSFGSTAAFAAAVEEGRVKAVAGISPFVQPADLLNHYLRPKLFISGTYDEWVEVRELARLVQNLPEPKELMIQPGVDHFWAGSENPLAEKISDFFAKYLTEGSGTPCSEGPEKGGPLTP
jgi:alpha/beta superfamily hydrolase